MHAALTASSRREIGTSRRNSTQGKRDRHTYSGADGDVKDNGDLSGSENGVGGCGTEDYDLGCGRSERGGRKNVWIMKPVGMSRGRGIRLVDDIKNISYSDKVRRRKHPCDVQRLWMGGGVGILNHCFA